METSLERIVSDPLICNGKPTIRGTRISVQTILEFLKAGDSTEEILVQYPSLVMEDIISCYEFAIKMASSSFYVKPIAVINA